MLRLCGFRISNYYNKVRLVLLEKAVPFEEVIRRPAQDRAVLEHSPMGKVPYLLTEHGPLSESHVITEYLEDAYPDTPLMPRTPYARAKCRELVQYIELHIELVVRRLYPEAFFGGQVSAQTKQEARALLRNGAAGLARLTRFDPFIAGNVFTLADCAAWSHLRIFSDATQIIYGEDMLDQIPGASAHLQLISARPYARTVNADRKAAFLEARGDRA